MSTAVAEPTTETNEAVEFHRFLGEQLQGGAKLKTPEQAVAAWRRQRPVPPELADGVTALREAIDAINAGDRGRPVAEVIADARRKLAAMSRS